MINTKIVHIITFQGREYDRKATPWEIARMVKEGIAKKLNGVLTFDFRS